MNTITKHLILTFVLAGLCEQSYGAQRPLHFENTDLRLFNNCRIYRGNFEGTSFDRGLNTIYNATGDIKVTDVYGHTILMWAIECQQPQLIQKFIDLGADVNARDNQGNTPLLWATHCRLTHTQILPLVLAGADVNAQNVDGETPLMYAVAHCSMNTINLLLEFGAEIDMRNIYGETALMWAAGFANTPAVELLLDPAAKHKPIVKRKPSNKRKHDVDQENEVLAQNTRSLMRDNRGLSALEWAEQKGFHTLERHHICVADYRKHDTIAAITQQQTLAREQIAEAMEIAENNWPACPLDVLNSVIQPFINPEHPDNN